MGEEIQSLNENNTFTLTNLPKGKKTVGGKWVYSIKSDIEGTDKYKARFVAKGYSQRMGIDYGETFVTECCYRKQHRRTCYYIRWM